MNRFVSLSSLRKPTCVTVPLFLHWLIPYQAFGSEGRGVRKTFCSCRPFTVRGAQMLNLVMGGFCASLAACLFVWPEPCSLLTARRGSQGPAACGLLGSTEMSVCLSLQSQSVNMTWSNNYYTVWQLCAGVCVCVCVCVRVFVLQFCATGGFFVPGQLEVVKPCSVCWTRVCVCVCVCVCASVCLLSNITQWLRYIGQNNTFMRTFSSDTQHKNLDSSVLSAPDFISMRRAGN